MITEELIKSESKFNGGRSVSDRKQLAEYFKRVRDKSVELCQPLVTEDYVIQTIDDVSPPKWHLGHITWFFEQVILEKFVKGYQPFNRDYYFCFNSYYESFGERVIRSQRGTVSRPTVEEVYDYRRHVDKQMQNLIETIEEKVLPDLSELVELGLNHEQQHQELLVTDVKHNFACNPMRPVYNKFKPLDSGNESINAEFISIKGGVHEIGAANSGFSYDNERPRHKTYFDDFKLMNRLVTCGEFMEFVNDGGYKKAQLWLSDGWETINTNHWQHPFYWIKLDEQWHIWTLSGLRPINPNEPVCHLSYYEADAYANWAGCRLPTEAEWEVAAQKHVKDETAGNFMDSKTFHPVPAKRDDTELIQMMGDVWEWTGSAYLPYPGYPRYPGPLGEYNGKFMINQMVLRGGSCATPKDHVRMTYRNFFQCDKRWQFSGMRLAKDA